MSKLTEQALQRWQSGPEDESVVDAMCDFAQKQMDEMALRVFEDTRERAAEIAAEAIAPNRRDIADAIRAMQPEAEDGK